MLSLWLTAAHVLLTVAGLLLSRHRSLQSHLSAHLRCAAYFLECSRYAPSCSGPCAVVTSPGTSAPARCFVALGCFVNQLSVPVVKGTRPPAVGYALSSWVLGSQSLAVFSWVLGPIPGCFTFFTAVWHVFHPTFSGHLLDVNLRMFHHRFWSSTTFIDFNVNFSFRITVADQSIESAQFITGFWNAHKPLVIIRITIFHAFRDVHYFVNVLNLRHPSDCSTMP